MNFKVLSPALLLLLATSSAHAALVQEVITFDSIPTGTVWDDASDYIVEGDWIISFGHYGQGGAAVVWTTRDDGHGTSPVNVGYQQQYSNISIEALDGRTFRLVSVDSYHSEPDWNPAFNTYGDYYGFNDGVETFRTWYGQAGRWDAWYTNPLVDTPVDRAEFLMGPGAYYVATRMSIDNIVVEYESTTSLPDADGDGRPDSTDNCPDDANTNQADEDADAYGDACDVCYGSDNVDPDGDLLCDSEDNCPDDANASQEDVDKDGIGDACDPTDDRSPGTLVYGTAYEYCPGAPTAVVDWSVSIEAASPYYTYGDGWGHAYAESRVPTTWNFGSREFSDPQTIFYVQEYYDYYDYGYLVSYNGQTFYAYTYSIGGNVVQGNVTTGEATVLWGAGAWENPVYLNDYLTGCYWYGTVAGSEDIVRSTDGNGQCDLTDVVDSDGDTIADDCDLCPADPFNLDADEDLICDADDLCLGDNATGDGDGDQVCDDLDLCEGNDSLGDYDLDAWCEDTDNCAVDYNPDQADEDADLIGDACEADTDVDGVIDDYDNCVADWNVDQADSDLDGAGDACDTDDDGDGVADTADNCPVVANDSQADFDVDGAGDACDTDDDADAVLDGTDLCPATSLGAIVNGSGCSGTQYVALTCGTEASWSTHGQYVSCVAQATATARSEGLISGSEGGVIVSTAAKSGTGKKK